MYLSTTPVCREAESPILRWKITWRYRFFQLRLLLLIQGFSHKFCWSILLLDLCYLTVLLLMLSPACDLSWRWPFFKFLYPSIVIFLNDPWSQLLYHSLRLVLCFIAASQCLIFTTSLVYSLVKFNCSMWRCLLLLFLSLNKFRCLNDSWCWHRC